MYRERCNAGIAAQMPLAEKAKAATYLIENDGSLEELEARVGEVHAAIVASL